MSKLVIFDLTRLIARRTSRTPTGIDRVDIKYALNFMDRSEGDFCYVRQDGERLVLLNTNCAREFIWCMNRIWNEGSREDCPKVIPDAVQNAGGKK